MAHDRMHSLITAMEQEAACLEEYALAQGNFGVALHGRDWPGLERSVHGLEDLAARVSALEAARAAAEASLRSALALHDGGFYHLALALREPERSEALDLHRRLRVAAMRVRIENQAAGEYATGAHALIGAVLEELFPEKRGKIYGRSGRARETGRDALVLDTAL